MHLQYEDAESGGYKWPPHVKMEVPRRREVRVFFSLDFEQVSETPSFVSEMIKTKQQV